VTIETPGIETETMVALHGLAIATSGESQRYFDHAGRRYAHTLDPRTGAPVGNGMISATVLDETCERADALATALTVLGPQEGARWAEERRIAALFVWREPGRIREWMSSRLATLAA
jgi:thiamine biosynthesis lipoprotein